MKHILDNAQMVNNTISLGKHVGTGPLDRDSGPSTSQLVGDVAAVDGGICLPLNLFLKFLKALIKQRNLVILPPHY